jgi:DNA-binding beta-propeller fold protein YncE
MDRRAFLGGAAATALTLARAPASLARVVGGTPLVFVTADRESHVAVFDLARRAVVRRIATPEGPRSIEVVGRGTAALAAHTALGSASILDARAMDVRHVIEGLGRPRYTAAGPRGRYAYVTDEEAGDLITIDLSTSRVVRRTFVGARARHLSLNARGRTIWVALGFSAPALAHVDLSEPSRPRLAGRIVPPFAAHDVVFAPDGARAWITSGNARRLAAYDVRTRRPVFEIDAGKPPQHVTFADDRVYVTSDDAVRVHRARDGRLLRKTAVPDGSYNVTNGWGLVFTPSLERGTLSLLDARGRLLSRPAVTKSAHDACFAINP